MSLDQRFPCIDDLARKAARRIPEFAHEYLIGGIGREATLARNRAALDAVLFDPCYLPEALANRPYMGVELLGRRYDLPFGVSPLGLSGLMWPRAVDILAKAAAKANIPFGLSHFGTTHMSDAFAIAGRNAWFQFYAARDPGIRAAMLDEIEATGFEVLIVTIDIPSATRRDRELRVGLSVPPRITPRTLWQIATHPRWALAMALTGKPEFKNLLPYIPTGLSMAEEARFLTDVIEGHVTRDILRGLRKRWKGKLVVKGIINANDAEAALDCGADAIWVSNHGGRQLDATCASVEALPKIRAAVGPQATVIADSGPRTGLDIARMIASGADFVFLGRPFVYAVAALGRKGGDHAIHILREELRGAMAQIGCAAVRDLPKYLLGDETSGQAYPPRVAPGVAPNSALKASVNCDRLAKPHS
ncbi:alpha-hydroxy acid oxidase [Defluviimonas salinarum]|uniref:Alpha-hydroxy-acid oxidizing protein n=1 Tax=Defluviimonas salinarum TaxID=2992147 RepID=A0ABT3J341_9RHOB|nr:alpha-hydroxy acid oxidase [Defluviimonas salinarum]MCW3782106.1 alpha-hydroxy-acid oxidizing protein [Defluviimonas salinarum]